MLPCDVGVVQCFLIGCFPDGGVVDTKDIAHTSAYVRATVVDDVRVGRVHKAVAAYLAVTDKTIAATELHETHHTAQGLEESLIADYPSCRESGEETIALARRKVFGTVIADVELSQVAVLPIVSSTSDESYLSVWNVGIGGGIIAGVLVVEYQCPDMVVAELSVVVERGLEIPVARA